MAKRPTRKPPQVSPPKREEIYLVNFDPTIGSEIRKTRPALVIQNDVSNRYSPVTIVAAITSKYDPEHLYPTEVLVEVPQGGLSLSSVVLLNQIRSIDRTRLVKRLGRAHPETMRQVGHALSISL